MNVLPVLVDLTPPPKLDLSTQGIGSSVGDFVHILDRALSGTNAAGGIVANGLPAASKPYASPTRQSPSPSPAQQQNPSNERQPPQAATHQSAASDSTPRSERSAPDRSKRRVDSNKDSSSSNNGASKSHESRQKATAKASSSSDGGAAANHHATSKKKSSAVGSAHSKAKSGKKQAASGKPASVVPFPGALILAGAHKAAGDTGKQTSAKTAKLVGVAKNLLKGLDTAKNAKQVAGPKAEPATKKQVDAKAKESKTKAVPSSGKGTVPSQLLASPLATANDPAAPQSMGAHAGPGNTDVQQQPVNPSGQNGTTNQTAAVTIVDLRQHNQNGSSSTGQDGGRGQSNNGGNARLFQLADGGATGPVKMNGQAGMARAAGAPSHGQGLSPFTDQIVKQTGILLRNNNSGEIRLLLKPEKLGNLRIKLDLNNNSLSGKIFVQNHQALRLVQQNLDSLYRALRESGFTTAELNVSVGGRDNGEKNRQRSSPLPSMRAIGGVKGFENQAPALETAGSYYSLVNLVI